MLKEIHWRAFLVIAALLLSLGVPSQAMAEKEDVYLEGERARFKVEKGKRYHWKWTGSRTPDPVPMLVKPEKSEKQETPLAAESTAEPAQKSAPEPSKVLEDEAMEVDEAETAAYKRLNRRLEGDSGSSGVTNAGGSKASVATGGGLKAGQEISDQAGVLSCRFTGLAEEEGKTVIRLLLKNSSGKVLSAIYGSFRILDSTGKVVRSAGVTYSAKPMASGEEKKMTLFRYLSLKENEEKLLKGDPGKVSLRFILDSVEYSDGTKATF